MKYAILSLKILMGTSINNSVNPDEGVNGNRKAVIWVLRVISAILFLYGILVANGQISSFRENKKT